MLRLLIAKIMKITFNSQQKVCIFFKLRIFHLHFIFLHTFNFKI